MMDAGVRYFQFDAFAAFQGIQHAVFSRQGGVSAEPFTSLNLSSSVNDNPLALVENRRRAYGIFGRNVTTLVHAHLIHDNHVTRVTQAEHGTVMPRCDGLITNDIGCGLTMNYADCGSVFLYDPHNHAIGLGHAGWRGAIVNLPGAMVQAMQAEFGSKPSEIRAALGPCISVSHYEVDEPVISEVKKAFPKWEERLLAYQRDGRDRPIGRPHFNLALANHINLYEAGVKNVELPSYCTATRTDLFFSHRAEKGKTGRFGAVFILKARDS